MIKYPFIVLFFLSPAFGMTQDLTKYIQQHKNKLDSLKKAFNHATNDSIRMDAARELGFYHQDAIKDSAVYYHEIQLALAKKLKLKLWEVDAYGQLADVQHGIGDYGKSYITFLDGFALAEDPSIKKNAWKPERFSFAKNPHEARMAVLGMLYYDMGNLYSSTGDGKKKSEYFLKALKIGENIQNKKIISLVYLDMIAKYSYENKLDSAFELATRTLNIITSSPYKRIEGPALLIMGNLYMRNKKPDSAKQCYFNAVLANFQHGNMASLSAAYGTIAQFYFQQGKSDSLLFYINKYEQAGIAAGDRYAKANRYWWLAYSNKEKNPDTAFAYLEKYWGMYDSLKNDYIGMLHKFQKGGLSEQSRLQEFEKERRENRNRTRIYAMLASLTVFVFIALILYFNNRQKLKANKVLATALANLKDTQSQLIQSEKMASLGELTAGIAHEIQNPLNFVNNFSEVNKELLTEMNAEIEKGNYNEVKEIAKDVTENEEKINHHGKRADAIVKGMLQHSRSSSGQKEPTDINTLADEYLRLSYHGLRAKDKSLNATLETDYDTSIGKISIVPQDIGRVVLNLITNAFYAVTEKKKQQMEGYEPTVSVSTKRSGDNVLISVKDNGNGIPQSIADKIFQPFFTTKPTGEGTGLGLSLGYDIVKAHGGEIKVETKEGEGSKFIIQLPIV